MQPHSPFVGVLVLHGQRLREPSSPVVLPDGTVVGRLVWWAWRPFEIFDPTGFHLLARGRREGYVRQRQRLYGPSGETLLEFMAGWFGQRRCSVLLPGGVRLSTRRHSFSRTHMIAGPDGTPVGRIDTSNKFMSFRPDTYTISVYQPYLSPVQAIGLAHCLHRAVEDARD